MVDCYVCRWHGIDCNVDEEDRYKPCDRFELVDTSWKCYARPAWRGGKTCGHDNKTGIIGPNGLVCCEECGCTQIASDLRRKELENRCRCNGVLSAKS